MASSRRSIRVLLGAAFLGVLAACASPTTSTGGGSCAQAPQTTNRDVALRISNEVVLQNAPTEPLMASSFRMHNAAGIPDQDLNGFLGFNAGLRVAFPDVRFTFTHVLAEGDLVLARYTAKATHKGEFVGIPATNKVVAWEGMWLRRVVGGKAVEEWNAPDLAGLTGQLRGTTAPYALDTNVHAASGDCAPATLQSAKDVGLAVSKNVVLNNEAPDSWMSPGFLMHNPNGIPDQNLQGFQGFNAGLRAAFPDIQFEFTHVLAEGDLVAARYTAKATHRGEFFGVPATQRSVAFQGMWIRRIAGGKAVEEWNAPDLAGIMAQLTAPK